MRPTKPIKPRIAATPRFPEAPLHYAAAAQRAHRYDPADPRLAVECQGQAFAATPVYDNSG